MVLIWSKQKHLYVWLLYRMCVLAFDRWSVVDSTSQYFLSAVVSNGHNTVIYTVLHLLSGKDNVWVHTHTHTHKHVVFSCIIGKLHRHDCTHNHNVPEPLTHLLAFHNTSLYSTVSGYICADIYYILSQIKYRIILSVFHNLLPHTHTHTPPVLMQMWHLWNGGRESTVLISLSLFCSAREINKHHILTLAQTLIT